MQNIPERSPARRLLSKETTFVPSSSYFHLVHLLASLEANFTKHPKSITSSSQVKLVRYQENPTSHWGPAARAAAGNAGKKRKRNQQDDV